MPRSAFAADLARQTADPSLAAKIRLWVLFGHVRVVACFRFGQAAQRLYARNRLLGLVPKVLSVFWRRWVQATHHVFLSRDARIGPGLMIMHDFGIFVGAVSIGANCVMHQNVTIGQRVAAADQGVPTLGDNVWIGPGST